MKLLRSCLQFIRLGRSRFWRYLGLFLAIVLLCSGVLPGLTQPPTAQGVSETDSRTLYETGRYAEAVSSLQRAIQTYRNQGDRFQEAIALRNLSLVYQQMGEWDRAGVAIADSLKLLKPNTEAYARALEVQAQLQFNQGQLQQAMVAWENATVIYQHLQNQAGIFRGTLQRAEILQSAGLYRPAIGLLEPLRSTLPARSREQGLVLRSLGEARRRMGELESAQSLLQQSLGILKALNDPDETSATLLSLADTLDLQDLPTDAWTTYREAASLTRDPVLLARIRLQWLRSLIANSGPIPEIRDLLTQLPPLLTQLLPGRAAIKARLHFAQSLLEAEQINLEVPLLPAPATTLAASHLAIAKQQAEQLQDARLRSLVLGNLGALYERTQQWPVAQNLTQQALTLSEQENATDIRYLWEWQMGRILQAQNQPEAAIIAYTDALNSLQTVRSDLVSHLDRQDSFQTTVDPLHRELVRLLVRPAANKPESHLEQARKTIESLQLTELDNFFREACLQARPVILDQLDPEAAVLYPVILGDRLEVILKLPQQPISHYAVATPSVSVQETARTLLDRLRTPPTEASAGTPDYLSEAQTLYNWLIRPVAKDLAIRQVKTLVFVLDGELRNLPMAVLHDGDRFLIEQYRIAVAPGLELLPSQPTARGRLGVLLAGVSEPHQGFAALEHVPQELEQIRATVGDRSRILLNRALTQDTLQQAIASSDFPIVHLATHGKLEATAQNTFILLGDEQRLNVTQLSEMLRSAEITRRRPIELLVLSACETAATTGDTRSALGLAGIAVRSGARSTIATLWQVSDAATGMLMAEFYQGLVQKQLPRAEALRQAQLSLLQNPSYAHPFFWSAAVLVGNWS